MDDHSSNADQAPPKIIVEKRGQYFISEKEIDAASGEPTWLASPIDPTDGELEIKIRVPRNADDRPQLLRVLSDRWDKAKLHLVRREGNNAYDVVAAEPSLRDSQRQVFDEKGHAFTWTQELDVKVDQFFHHAVHEGVLLGQSRALDDSQILNGINERASDIFAQQMTSEGDRRPNGDLRKAYANGVHPKLDGARETFADILQGREISDSGDIVKIFYNTMRSFSEHKSVSTDPTVRATSIANYASQRAAFEYLHGFASQTVETVDGGRFSIVEKAEHDLVTRRALFGYHPARTSEDYTHLTAEFAERLAMMNIQGAVYAAGGRPADKSLDNVTPNEKSERDPSGNAYTIQSYLRDQIVAAGTMPSYQNHERSHGDPKDWYKRYTHECLDLTRQFMTNKELSIAGEMDRAMGNGRTRLSDPTSAVNKRLEQSLVAERALLGIFEELENPPEIF